MQYAPYTVVFEDSDRFDDVMYLNDPTVGDTIKVGMLSAAGELEYYEVVAVQGDVVRVRSV